MEDRCAGTHTQLRGIQEKACKAQPWRDNYCKRAILCLSSSKILTPTPLSARLCWGGGGGGDTLAGRREGWDRGGQYFGRRETYDCPLTVLISLRAQRFLSCVSAVTVMWSLKNNLEKIWIGLTKVRVFVKTVQQKRVFVLGLE
jgi:hypothetical protein